jgi:hypothetical protein
MDSVTVLRVVCAVIAVVLVAVIVARRKRMAVKRPGGR